MNPPFGTSTLVTRARKVFRRSILRLGRFIISLKPSRPRMGNMWLRLGYFEDRLAKLDQEKQEIFIENFYHSARQVNYVTLTVIIVIIAVYLTTFQFSLIGFWEGIVIEAVMGFTMFYIVWFYRLGMEDLMDYLTRMGSEPDFAFRPRFRKARKT